MAAAPVCRDCLRVGDATAPRCPACGSPRVLSHAERDALAIAHIDCDAFFAAIEKRDDPSLNDKPVIVGGGKRGVVATACYVARTYGIRSAMPMFKALNACPHAVVIPPDIDKYSRVGREVRRLMLELTPLVEPVSIDEAFLDLSGTERLHHASPALTLVRFAKRVEQEIGITVSVGLSCNKFLAKIASDLDKPRGFSVIGRAEAAAFLENRPVGIIPGIGAGAARQGRHHPHPAPSGGTERKPRHPRPRRGAPAPAFPRRGRSSGLARARDQEHFGRNHLRAGPFLLRRPAADPLAPMRAGGVAPEAGGPCRTQRHPEAQGLRLSPAHPHALRPAGDAARRAPVRARAGPA